MPKQPAIPGLRDAMKKKVTRREQFLAEMDAVVPWDRLLALIEPHYPKAGPKGGRPPMPLETMLRVYFLQNWYALSDPMAEETLYDRWDGCRPPQNGIAMCQVGGLRATERRGRRHEGYDNRSGFGKAGISDPRRVNEWRGAIPQEAHERAVPRVHGEASAWCRGVRGLRQCELLGARDGVPGTRGQADRATIRPPAVSEGIWLRRAGRFHSLRG